MIQLHMHDISCRRIWDRVDGGVDFSTALASEGNPLALVHHRHPINLNPMNSHHHPGSIRYFLQPPAGKLKRRLTTSCPSNSASPPATRKNIDGETKDRSASRSTTLQRQIAGILHQKISHERLNGIHVRWEPLHSSGLFQNEQSSRCQEIQLRAIRAPGQRSKLDGILIILFGKPLVQLVPGHSSIDGE